MKTYKDKDFLFEQLIVLKRPIQHIAQEFDVKTYIIRNWAKKFNIKPISKTKIIEYNGKYIKISKQIKYIDNVVHVECCYLRKFLPITDFAIRKRTEQYYYIEQPSRPGIKQKSYDIDGVKPKPIFNKIIDGKLYRFCKELKEYLPIEEFSLQTSRKNSHYRTTSNRGRTIENRRNKDKIYPCIRAWKEKNRHKVQISYIKRKEYSKCATPLWLTEEHLRQMQQIYEEATKLQRETGVKYHVHHIYPLHGEDDKGNHISCGLNVPWNLVATTAEINLTIQSKNPEFHPFKFQTLF